jgi:hypothetical protein
MRLAIPAVMIEVAKGRKDADGFLLQLKEDAVLQKEKKEEKEEKEETTENDVDDDTRDEEAKAKEGRDEINVLKAPKAIAKKAIELSGLNSQVVVAMKKPTSSVGDDNKDEGGDEEKSRAAALEARMNLLESIARFKLQTNPKGKEAS